MTINQMGVPGLVFYIETWYHPLGFIVDCIIIVLYLVPTNI